MAVKEIPLNARCAKCGHMFAVHTASGRFCPQPMKKHPAFADPPRTAFEPEAAPNNRTEA